MAHLDKLKRLFSMADMTVDSIDSQEIDLDTQYRIIRAFSDTCC
ncbi:hypothetical protein ACMGD3_10915 [Lysinibacillus sphaericus]